MTLARDSAVLYFHVDQRHLSASNDRHCGTTEATAPDLVGIIESTPAWARPVRSSSNSYLPEMSSNSTPSDQGFSEVCQPELSAECFSHMLGAPAIASIAQAREWQKCHSKSAASSLKVATSGASPAPTAVKSRSVCSNTPPVPCQDACRGYPFT